MDSQEALKYVLSIIKEKYVSLESPNFCFVSEVYNKNPYEKILKSLNSYFSHIKDDTDLNYDHCFRYLLSSNFSREELTLELSMLAPLAVILKSGPGNKPQLVDPEKSTLTQEESELINILNREKIQFPNKELLSYPANLKLFYTEPENVMIYQALFSDIDVAPWLEK
jgi:hypothetical protein